MAELLELFLSEGREPVPTDPGSVWTTNGAVWQFVTGGRTINNSRSVLSCPIGEVIAKNIASFTAVQPFGSHDDQLFLGGEFHEYIAIVATKPETLFLG